MRPAPRKAASKAALKHAKETSDAVSRARSRAGSKKMPVPHTPRCESPTTFQCQVAENEARRGNASLYLRGSVE